MPSYSYAIPGRSWHAILQSNHQPCFFPPNIYIYIPTFHMTYMIVFDCVWSIMWSSSEMDHPCKVDSCLRHWPLRRWSLLSAVVPPDADRSEAPCRKPPGVLRKHHINQLLPLFSKPSVIADQIWKTACGKAKMLLLPWGSLGTLLVTKKSFSPS